MTNILVGPDGYIVEGTGGQLVVTNDYVPEPRSHYGRANSYFELSGD